MTFGKSYSGLKYRNFSATAKFLWAYIERFLHVTLQYNAICMYWLSVYTVLQLGN